MGEGDTGRGLEDGGTEVVDKQRMEWNSEEDEGNGKGLRYSPFSSSPFGCRDEQDMG